jgi:hypothetical protein
MSNVNKSTSWPDSKATLTEIKSYIIPNIRFFAVKSPFISGFDSKLMQPYLIPC